MFEIKAKDKMVERALLVGAYIGADKKADAQSLLAELEELVDTLGLPVVERMLVHHREDAMSRTSYQNKIQRSRPIG